MDIRAFYNQINGSYEEALRRLMNEALVLRFVKKFAEDRSFAELKEAMLSREPEAAFRAAHQLKGVAGNLAFTGLAELAGELTELLRSLQSPDAAAEAVFDRLSEEYGRIIRALSKLDGGALKL